MLANFGNAAVQEESASTKATITLSDPYYLSPENLKLFREEGGEKLKPGKKSDVWALGILLLELCNLERMGDGNEVEGHVLYEYRDAPADSEWPVKHPSQEANEPIIPHYDIMIDQAKARYPNLAHIIDAVLVEEKNARPLCSSILMIPMVQDRATKLI